MTEIKSYSETYSKLTSKMFAGLCRAAENENVVFSPFSILVLLAVLCMSTDGITQDEVVSFLSEEMKKEDVIALYAKLKKLLMKDGKFISSDAVCIKDTIKGKINTEYIESLRNQFDGEVFFSENLVKSVNDWVKEKTNGLIDHIMEESDENSLFSLLNAASFDGKWLREYTEDDIDYDDFCNSDESVSTVAMIRDTEHEYIENDEFTGFVKPYKNSDFSFMALLPKEEVMKITDEYVERIDLVKLFESRRHEDVLIKLPEFEAEDGYEMKDLFKEQGIRTVFTDDADFSAASGFPLKAESVRHKAKIMLDRKGTKAVAVTAMFAVAGCLPDFEEKRVILDRPFVYAIVHRVTGLPVFAGIINQLEDMGPVEYIDFDEFYSEE